MDENYQRYLELIENFYQSKNHYLGNKDKHLKCDDCKTDKQFIESQKEIILSCGDTGKCGKKIEIILPKYIYKDREIDLLKSNLEEAIDWDIINKYIKVDSKLLEDNKELIESNNKQITEIKQKYYEVYKKINVQLINEKYSEIIKLKAEIKDIRENLLDISLSSEQKKVLRTNYIEKNNNINQLYLEIRENNDDIKEYFMESEPAIKIGKLDIISTQKQKKKKKKKDVKKKLTFDDLKVGMRISYMNKDKEYKGTIINMDPKENKKVMIKFDGKTKEQLIRISGLTIIKEEKVEEEKVEEEKVEEEKVEEEKVEEEKVEDVKEEKVEEEKEEKVEEEKSQKIEIGSKVKWEDKGKSLTGIVEKETASNYKICCKPGKKPGDKGSVYQVPKDKVELDQ
jgi:hypothetical protein